VIEVLKSATLDGGVHLVETIVAGQTALTIDELRAQYRVGRSPSSERNAVANVLRAKAAGKRHELIRTVLKLCVFRDSRADRAGFFFVSHVYKETLSL
jgi:hypothetical protein